MTVCAPWAALLHAGLGCGSGAARRAGQAGAHPDGGGGGCLPRVLRRLGLWCLAGGRRAELRAPCPQPQPGRHATHARLQPGHTYHSCATWALPSSGPPTAVSRAWFIRGHVLADGGSTPLTAAQPDSATCSPCLHTSLQPQPMPAPRHDLRAPGCHPAICRGCTSMS